MIKYICDICKKDIPKDQEHSYKVTNGEHPHNGSEMTKTVDVCSMCAIDTLQAAIQEKLGV